MVVYNNNVQDYYDTQAVSQSKLKTLLTDPNLFNKVDSSELYFEEKKHFVVGSAVDIILTGELQDFGNKYHVSTLENKPSDVVKSIINQVFDEAILQGTDSLLNDISYYRDYILASCDTHEYCKTFKDDTRINKVCEHYEYWNELQQSLGKTILSKAEYILVCEIAMSIRTSQYTNMYFTEAKNIDIYYQLALYENYKGIDCKALLDMVIVNHKDKTIQPIDIKTLGDYTLNFPKSVRQRRYDLQASYYTKLLEIWLEVQSYKDYTILPFKFIVESTVQPGNPLVFTCSESLLRIGQFGKEVSLVENFYKSELIKIGYKVKGFEELLKDYVYYLNSNFEQSKLIRDNQGELSFDWEGIIE